MNKLMRLAVLSAVIAISLATAAPASANGDNEVEWSVCPTLGHQTDADGNPIVIPTPATVKPKQQGLDHPTLGPAGGTDFNAAEPGDVFWTD